LWLAKRPWFFITGSFKGKDFGSVSEDRIRKKLIDIGLGFPFGFWILQKLTGR